MHEVFNPQASLEQILAAMPTMVDGLQQGLASGYWDNLTGNRAFEGVLEGLLTPKQEQDVVRALIDRFPQSAALKRQELLEHLTDPALSRFHINAFKQTLRPSDAPLFESPSELKQLAINHNFFPGYF